MPAYPDMNGFYEDPLGYSNPDMNGFEIQPRPRFYPTATGPDMNGFMVPIPGMHTGQFGANPLLDGPIWNQINMPSIDTGAPNIGGNGVIIVAYGGTSNAVFQRLDLRDPTLTWKLIVAPVSTDWAVSASNGKGEFVLIGSRQAQTTNYAISSDGGQTWNSAIMPALAFWYALGWGCGTYVALTYSTTSAYISPDGRNWTPKTMPAANNWRGVACNGNGRWVANADNTAVVSVSTDNGNTWATAGSLSAATVNPVRFGGGWFFVAAGANLNFSRDGVTWITIALGANYTFGCFAKGLYFYNLTTSATIIVIADPTANTFYSLENVLPSAVFWWPLFEGGVLVWTQLGAAVSAVAVF